MFVTDKVDKIAKLTTKVNTGGSLPHLSKGLILIPQMKQNYFKQIFIKTILFVVVDVCVGETQLEVTKGRKLAISENIGAVECRTCPNMWTRLSETFNMPSSQ